MKLLAIILTLAAGVLPFSTDYCSTTLCSNHIACDNDGSFAESCPESARLVDIKPHINEILKAHNKRRNRVAKGKLRGYKPAKRMATMKWDKELAYLAELNVKQCVMKAEKCRFTETFDNPGQNLGQFGYTGAEKSYDDLWLINNRIDAWWGEHADCKMKYIDAYPSSYKGRAIGHFTIMINEQNTRIGCAASRWKDVKFNRFLMTCNYATTNWVGSPTYVSGRPASGCTTGKNGRYKFLCSTAEPYSE